MNMMLNFGKRKTFKSGQARAIVIPAFWVKQFLPNVDLELDVTGDERQLIIKIPAREETPAAAAPPHPA